MMPLQVDVHGYAPGTIWRTGFLTRVLEQAWEMGYPHVEIIHGHGMNRDAPLPFANTNTGRLGLAVRGFLRNTKELRRWAYAKIDVRSPGTTCEVLKENPNPTRKAIDERIFPELDFRR